MESKNIYHILNGDALKDQFPTLTGETIVARECLVDGDVSGESLEELWENRAAFLSKTYGEKLDYNLNVVSEFQKILAIPNGAEVNLWFEYDLFCQVNFWFCCWLLKEKKNLHIYFVSPFEKVGWWGFAGMSPDNLKKAYQEKDLLSHKNINDLADCWTSYKSNNNEELLRISESINIPFFKDVVRAHIDRNLNNGFGRPEMSLKEIISEKQTTDFKIIFPEFIKREGIYGFGDLQVKKMLNEILDE